MTSGTIFVPLTVPSGWFQDIVSLHGNLILILIYSMLISKVYLDNLFGYFGILGLRVLIKFYNKVVKISDNK